MPLIGYNEIEFSYAKARKGEETRGTIEGCRIALEYLVFELYSEKELNETFGKLLARNQCYGEYTICR